MKLRYVLWVYYWINIFFCYSQGTSGTLSGKVTDQNGPVAFANVVVLQADSTFVEGTITDDKGEFSFDHLGTGKKIIQFSFVGYNTRVIEFAIAPGINRIGNIELEPVEIELNEIVVTANRPVFKMENGNLVTMVSNSLLSTLGTAGDILERIPGIDCKNNSIQVFGKGTPVIYVNNRKLHDISELEQIQSGDILSVELIKNPGARYDATDRAVIVIKTKKRRVVFPHSFLTG